MPLETGLRPQGGNLSFFRAHWFSIKKARYLAGLECAGFADGFGFTFGMGLAAHTRFSASLKGITGPSPETGAVFSFVFGVAFMDDDSLLNAYHAALGEFVDTYAAAEDFIFLTMQAMSRFSAEEAAAVYSGTRVTTATTFIRRLYEARKSTLPKRTDEALQQLAAITTMRDQLLHYGIRLVDGELYSSTALRAHHPTKHRRHSVSPEMLQDMTADLRVIITILGNHIITVAPQRPDLGEPPTPFADAQAPWRYRSQSPTPADRRDSTGQQGRPPVQDARR